MYSVLIVEDELLVSIGLRNMIDWEALNMQVIGDAPNGEAALSLYHQHKPDLILTDIKMPVMDGIQLIEAIRKEDQRTRIVILTCVQEFDSLHRAMHLSVSDYILKLTMTTNQMTEVVQKIKKELDEEGRQSDRNSNSPLLAEQLLADFVCGGCMNAEDFRVALSKAGFDLPEQGLVVCLIQVLRGEGDEAEETTASPEADQPEYMSAILRNLLIEQLEREGCGRLVRARNNRFVMVLALGNQPSLLKRKSILAGILGRVRENVKTYLDVEVIFALSSIADSFERMPGLYEEACTAFAESYYVYRLPYTQFSAPENKQSFGILLEGFKKRVAENALLDSAYQSVIQESIATLDGMYAAPKQQVWELFERLIHWSATHAVRKVERLFTLTLETTYSVHSCASLEQIIDVFELFLQALAGGQSRARQISREVAKAVEYIYANYASEVSLQTVADYVEMSANYLSSLFKKELEIGFVDFLNQVRIEEAGRLLQDTNLKTYEVAIRVGFSDESYFSRIFKRVKGVRPREYKRTSILVDTEGGMP